MALAKQLKAFHSLMEKAEWGAIFRFLFIPSLGVGACLLWPKPDKKIGFMPLSQITLNDLLAPFSPWFHWGAHIRFDFWFTRFPEDRASYAKWAGISCILILLGFCI